MVDIGKLLVRGLLQLGVGGPQLVNNAGVIEARNPGNTGLADVRGQTLRAAQSLAIGDIDIYAVTSSLPPASPGNGDLWFEVDPVLQQLYGWPWVRFGGNWISPEQRRSLSFDTVSANFTLNFHLDQTLDTLIKSVQVTSFVATTNNASNHWSYQLSRVAANNTGPNIGAALTTASQAVNTWGAITNTPNETIDVSATGARIMRLNATRVGNPGINYGSAEIVFNYVRP